MSNSLSAQDTLKAIRGIYTKLVLYVHPDKTTGKVYQKEAEELFKLVNEAYETLTDADKKQLYDAKSIPQASSSTKTRSTGSHSTTSTFNFGGTFFTQNEQSSDQVYTRDIQENEVIKGNTGNVIICGNVFGTVKNIMGNITIHGNVYGTVKNDMGNNIINGSVMKGAKVSTAMGNNIVTGEAFGVVKADMGENQISGQNATPKSTKSKATSSVNSNTRVFFSSDDGTQNVFTSNVTADANGNIYVPGINIVHRQFVFK